MNQVLRQLCLGLLRVIGCSKRDKNDFFIDRPHVIIERLHVFIERARLGFEVR